MAEAIWISAPFFFILWESKPFLSPIFGLQHSSCFLGSKLTFDFKGMKFLIWDRMLKIFESIFKKSEEKPVSYIDQMLFVSLYVFYPKTGFGLTRKVPFDLFPC